MPKKKKGPKKDKDETLTRIAIVNSDKCKPKKCRQECKKGCPVVRMGKLCIEVGATSKLAWISEELCIGCGICKKKCPFGAINIINLPKDLEGQTTHRFGQNSFKLHRLPMPRPGQVLGLVGTNGIGKSTALKILAGKLKPNLGQFDRQADWEEILTYFRGSELQNYFTKLLEDDIKAIIKPQYVDQIPHAVKGSVRRILTAKNDPDRDKMDEILEELDLGPVIDRTVDKLSGGELQRFAIGVVSVQNADVYMLDEPSSYLDVKQRLKAARVIRRLAGEQKYVICVEHDLSVLDYLSDYICVLYGVPGAYGVVTMPFSVRDGINIFLAGFIRTENLRFRDEELDFKLSESAEVQDADAKRLMEFQYPDMVKTLTSKGNKFVLEVEEGGFTDSEIIVLLGENGTGKTTFIRMLAGLIQPDAEPEPSSEEEFDLSSDEDEGQHYGKKADGSIDYSNYIGEKKKEKEVKGPKKKLPVLSVSYKPQKISPKFQGTVRMLMHKRIRDAYVHPQFVTDVIKPLKVDRLMDQEVRHLSGGELQRCAICLSLGKPAEVYLIDEPSAYLDSEQRITASKVIKRFIMHSKKTAFVVEHDFIMATYLADRVIVYNGVPSKNAQATTPQGLLTGMNQFLKHLEITFRRDPTNYRPRINKEASVKDQEQKASGNFFFMDAE